MITVANVLERTQYNLSQLPGVGTQVFSQDVLLEKLHLAVDTLLGKKWWKPYMNWLSSPLDGTLGVLTTNMSALPDGRKLKFYKDIQHVIPDGQMSEPLPEAPDNVPPSVISNGTAPKFIDEIASEKIFCVYPSTAVGILHVRYRSRPDTYNLDTLLYLDDTLLIRATAFQYLADDGTNPDGTSVAQSALDEIYKQEFGGFTKPFALDERRQQATAGLFQWS